MAKFLQYMVFLVFMCPVKLTGTFPPSGLDLGASKTRRDIHCGVQEYLNSNICCLNCPAGYRMVSPCTTGGEKGMCEECEDGTYLEHSNGLKQCFKCTQCRSDQEIARPCTHTQNTECQCRSGRFCAPDQACEVCKKCSRCEKDEETVRNCTSTSNTDCKKTQPNPSSASEMTSVIALSLLGTGVLVVFVVCLWRRCRATDSQRNQPVGLKAGQHYTTNSLTEERSNRETQRPSCSSLILSGHVVRTIFFGEDERKVLCESLNSSASNSQHSLNGLSSSAFPTSPPRASPMVPQPHRREDEEFPKLVPVNGDESLRKCFEYFEEIDVDYHKRFFRHLGITDNVIKSKEHLHYEDKIHELLNIWVEKEGREASLNDLLKVLLVFNQRRTAEAVKENAIHNGHYFCEN
uniref:hematopoietic death receptor isoform X2 n=2 Tax=Semicossyphus pulcher TaxID=241346 RepID=UPI0037E91FD6